MNSASGFRIPVPDEDSPVIRQTAYEYVRSVVRRAILNGDLVSGSRLVQAELAANLNVSTTPVREALRDLATEGLIQFDPHRGAIVTELSENDLHDIYELRLVLEPLAVRQAAENVSEALIERLRNLHARMIDEPHAAEWVDHNRVFHMAVYEAAASPRLAAIIRNLQDASVMYIGASLHNQPSLRDEANEDHGVILAALERHDVDAAVEAVEKHLRTSIVAYERSEAASD